MFNRCSYEVVLIGVRGEISLETGRWTMSENVSRRKMLSLLGLGAALGFTLSATLEPLEAEAQEAAPATPNPTAPATGSAPATGTRGRNRRTSRRATRHQPRGGAHRDPRREPEARASPPQTRASRVQRRPARRSKRRSGRLVPTFSARRLIFLPR